MIHGPNSFLLAATLLLALNAHSVEADTRRDSLTLFGAWKWTSSGGEGSPAGWATVSVPGCSSVLYLHRDGTYAYWERDSLGDNLLCHGRFKVHGKGEWPQFPRA